MDVTPLHERLSGEAAESIPRHVLELLGKTENKTVRSCLDAMLSSMQEVNRLVQSRPDKYETCYMLEHFCDQLNRASGDTLISFSSDGCSGLIPESLKDRLYMVITYLCGHALAKRAMFVLTELCCEKRSITLTLDADIAFIHGIDNSDSLLLDIALNEIRTLGGRLRGDRIGMGQRFFRLTLTIEVSAGRK